jgi:hypothetical protein
MHIFNSVVALLLKALALWCGFAVILRAEHARKRELLERVERERVNRLFENTLQHRPDPSDREQSAVLDQGRCSKHWVQDRRNCQPPR